MQGGDLPQVLLLAPQAGDRDPVAGAEEAVVLLQGLDQGVVGGQPDRAAPVGVAAEQR